jgi:4-hydroxythreonine-4-phosphate dehydrogenase
MPIAITMGDSSGVGPEIVLHAFRKGELPRDFVVVGDYEILAVCNRMLGYDAPLRKSSDVADVEEGCVNILDLGLMKADDLRVGQVSRLSGCAALKYVECATRLALAGKVSAVVTLPINKEATRLTEPDFSGHTEYVAGMCGVSDYTMMLASNRLIVTHVSTHVALRNAVDLVRKERVLEVIRLTNGVLPKLRTRSRIAVAGLNPHAGENASFGTEDLVEIEPAVREATEHGIDAHGPFPPDTIFMQVLKGNYDAVVCMYHDQGHIPMKLLDFEGGINVTLGLPIVRTSVDHGTAFDIAYQGVAFTGSLRDACKLAERLA